MGDTNIEWADAVWNPVRGCTRVSEGCRNCYAEAVAARFSKRGLAYSGFASNGVSGPRWSGKVSLIEERLDDPLRWKKPKRIFVNSMSDLFHERLSFEDIRKVFAVMFHASGRTNGCSHTFLILTKRPQRMLEFSKWWVDGLMGEPLGPECPRIWWGVSVEDQATADERIPLLLKTPAAVRFVSYEPALGPVDFSRWMWPVHDQWPASYSTPEAARAAGATVTRHPQALVSANRVFLDWIIVGGESGPHARPFDVAWARSTIAQCKDAGVACFVKQLGSRPIQPISPCSIDCQCSFHRGFHNRKGGDMSEWPEDLRVREFPNVATNRARAAVEKA